MAGARVMTCEIHRETCPVAHRSAGTGPCSRPAADLSARLSWWLSGGGGVVYVGRPQFRENTCGVCKSQSRGLFCSKEQRLKHYRAAFSKLFG